MAGSTLSGVSERRCADSSPVSHSVPVSRTAASSTRVRFGWVGVALLASVLLAGIPLAAGSDSARGSGLSAPKVATVGIGANAMRNGYSTPTVSLARGGTLYVRNDDSVTHSVTSTGLDKQGNPLFDTVVGAGQLVAVPGVNALAAGKYPFYCKYHPSMSGTLVISGKGGGTTPVTQTFDQRLVLPRQITSAHVTLPVTRTAVRVLPTGPKTVMWTYGGSYPGPTIRRHVGDDTKITLVDKLPSAAGPLSLHLHGDHHSAANDGQPMSHLVRPSASRTYDYPLTDSGRAEPPAFDFYHDHVMGSTGRNTWQGLQGMLITDDGREKALGLPTGRYDVPLDVADRQFDAQNQLVDPATLNPAGPPGDSTVGDKILVDGRYAPYLDVSTHRYRLRLLNGSNFQSYDFVLSDGAPFVQIGTGDSLLPKPVLRSSIRLGPAQRADVVVDFGSDYGKRVVLQSQRTTNGIGTPAAAVMEFRVVKRVADPTRVPTVLEATPRITVPKKVSATWSFGFDSAARVWTVDGRPYDPARIDAVVTLGSTVRWRLRNTSSITHYIHVHEEQWHTVSRDGHPPTRAEGGLQDTWRLNPGEYVDIAAKVTDYTGIFMIHCHMLDHEDHGMMAQFEVVKPGSAASFAAPTTGVTGETSMSAMPGMSLTPHAPTARLGARTDRSDRPAALGPVLRRAMTSTGLAVLVDGAVVVGLLLLVRRLRQGRAPS